MDELPKDLARPKSDWPIGDVMGIVVGGLLLALVIGLLVFWVVTQ